MADQPSGFDDDHTHDHPPAPRRRPPRVRDLAALFEAPATRRRVRLMPDDADYIYGDTADMLVGLLHDASDLRVGTLCIEIEVELPPGSFADRGWDGHLIPLVVARGRGAWVVCTCHDDPAADADEAIALRVLIVEQLCQELGWNPADVPLGATLVAPWRDFGPDDDTGALPRHELVGRSQLPGLLEHFAALPVGPPERQGRLRPELTERFFVDIATVGQWLDDTLDHTIDIPGWMVRRPH